MLNRSTATFGDYRKFNGEQYSLHADFDMITERSRSKFDQKKAELKAKNVKYKIATNRNGEKALYIPEDGDFDL